MMERLHVTDTGDWELEARDSAESRKAERKVGI